MRSGLLPLGLFPLGLFLLGLFLVGCNDDETVWVQFNADDQVFVIDVLPAGSEPGEPLTLELLSNLGRTVVGEAEVSPGSGPVGTEHSVFVDVYDDFEATVGRSTVIVESEAVEDLDGDGDKESRGEGEYELRRDSADPGAYAITLQSLGFDDEERQDQFTIVLWQPEALATPVGTTE